MTGTENGSNPTYARIEALRARIDPEGYKTELSKLKDTYLKNAVTILAERDTIANATLANATDEERTAIETGRNNQVKQFDNLLLDLEGRIAEIARVEADFEEAQKKLLRVGIESEVN